MISFTTGVYTGMAAGGAAAGRFLWNRPYYGLFSGVLHSVIAIGIKELLGKKVSAAYLACVVIYTIGCIGRKAQEIQSENKLEIITKKSWTVADRIQIATETLKCIEQGYYVNSKQERIPLQSVEDLYKKSVCVTAMPVEPDKTKYEKTDIVVVSQDCMEVAQEQVQQGAKVALLNFASPIEPGGGFEEGTNGQEEQLCYSSELAGFMKEVLIQYTSPTGTPFFPLNNYQRIKYEGSSESLQHYKLVYTPEVNFFRSNATHSYAFLDAPFKAGVLSSAAPTEPQLKTLEDGSVDYADEAIREYVRRAITLQLFAAYESGHETVILGAFGCGAFKNPPQAVAKLYKEVIDAHFKGAFSKIIFTILEDPYRGAHNPIGNIKPFQECFPNKSMT